jgi:hypothetical protein
MISLKVLALCISYLLTKYRCIGGGLGSVHAGGRGVGATRKRHGQQQQQQQQQRSCGEETKKFETFRELRTTEQLMGSDREARPSVQYVQCRVLRNGFETLASMCVREGSSGP